MTTDHDVPQLQRWREERAYRAGNTIARVLFITCAVAFVINALFATPIEALADVVVAVGCGISLYLTRRKKPELYFVWWPIYISFFIAILPSTWKSGGVYSPWLGIYMVGLAIIGTVIQAKASPIYNTFLVLLNVAAWTAYQHYNPLPPQAPYPVFFVGGTVCIMLMGVGYFLYDIIKTEKILAEQFERQYAELFEARASLVREENANQAKTDFLANISHELRTPLGAVLGYAQLLQDDSVSTAEKINFAKTIERNGTQLARLVDDLLDLSKVEAGEIGLEKIDFNVKSLIDDVLELFQMKAAEKHILLSARYASDIPENLRTDPFRLKQIITNILGNALKFTDSGHVEIVVRYNPNDLPGQLILTVRDTGRGISPEERKKLFKRFSQADTSTTRKYGGTGLGLNFSKQLANLFGGDLELTWSQLGVGSEFTLRIPVELPAAKQMTTSSYSAPTFDSGTNMASSSLPSTFH